METSIGLNKTRAAQIAEILTSAILRVQASRGIDALTNRGRPHRQDFTVADSDAGESKAETSDQRGR